MGMKVREMMTPGPISISPETSAKQASEMLAHCRIGALIVQGEDGMIGILSERDVVTKIAARGLSTEIPVQEIMSDDVQAVSIDADPYEALNLMLYEHIRHLPVVAADGSVVGMLSMRDLLRHMLERGVLI